MMTTISAGPRKTRVMRMTGRKEQTEIKVFPTIWIS